MNNLMQLSPEILWRFEPELGEGTLFLFACSTKRLMTGNRATYEVLRHVNGLRPAAEVAELVSGTFAHLPADEVQKNVLAVLKSLAASGVLEPAASGAAVD